ncbi:hypothetical protein ERO13_A13G102100v2 [Gossypium hirsutum]|nr:hypothetical protein ERO13_A13G102100v2 [Gossypium hirsutum]
MHVVIQILLLLLSYLTCGVLRELFDRDVACARSPIRSSKVLTLEFDLCFNQTQLHSSVLQITSTWSIENYCSYSS